MDQKNLAMLEKIQQNLDKPEVLSRLLPIVRCSLKQTRYEQILSTQLRQKETSTMQFREASEKIGGILVSKVVECLPTHVIEIETPIEHCPGTTFAGNIELLSVMRSGDALLDTFMKHFPHANVSKILVQRDEETAEPHFKYMKVSPTLASGNPVVITEPMIATGGTLITVIQKLIERGVKEENIIIASVCTAPEGLVRLAAAFPKISVVLTMLDTKLNEKKYIVPGLGDYGDRFFGTPDHGTER
ncbi:MAG: uracil phosphoribosyltransferase [Chlamydiota bacterium]